MASKTGLWKKKPEAKDFDAARDFLSLLYSDGSARKLARAMRKTKTVEHVAKDLLRASGLPLLAPAEIHVAEDLERLRRGEPLAPVLLVRSDHESRRKLVITDGYHRICAICHYDEDAPVSCRIVAD